MWVLESDGPLFGGKRLWLRPGSAQLFGRVKEQSTTRNTDSYVIDAKSVSKKHLKISVAAVRAGTGSQIYERTELIIEDFSKLGTTIDGDKISQATKVLRGDEHAIKVSKYEHLLRIKWQPVVITVSDLTKLEKYNPDPLLTVRQKLEPLGMKMIQDYIPDTTTHVIANKRNIPPVLQALIYGKYVTTRDYVDALASAAAEEPSENGREPRSALERDFDAAWPDPMRFVPTVANEPVPRDASYLTPRQERGDIFYGFTFVFCQKTQFDNLLPVINAGSGKAILFEGFQEGKTDARDFVAFVKNVAGVNGSGELESDGKGVVVVRMAAKSQNQEWATHFIQQSDEELNQRSIEQRDLLDPILTVDTSNLRQKLTEEIDLTSVRSSQLSRREAQAATDASPTSPTEPVKPEPLLAKKKSKRPPTQRRFKGFDDFDDGSFSPVPMISEDMAPEETLAPTQQSRIPNYPDNTTDSRKRGAPDPDNDAVMDEILPTAAAMKRRRLNQHGSEATHGPEPRAKPLRRPKKEREIDLLEEAKKRREQEEEKAREDAEALRQAMDGIDIEGPAHLVEIKDMEVRPASVSAATSHRSSERWDERWNDRPNFKKFRRKGEPPPDRSQKVILPLEQIKKKDFGIGEDYWLDSSARQKESQQPTQVSQTLRDEVEDNDDGSQFRRTRRRQGQDKDEDVQVVEDSVPTASEPSQQRSQAMHSQPQTQSNASRKRPAPEPAKKPPPPKKTRQITIREESEDDDDELSFRRSRTIRGTKK